MPSQHGVLVATVGARCVHSCLVGLSRRPVQGLVLTAPGIDVAKDLALRVMSLLAPLLVLLIPGVRLIPALPVEQVSSKEAVVRPLPGLVCLGRRPTLAASLQLALHALESRCRAAAGPACCCAIACQSSHVLVHARPADGAPARPPGLECSFGEQAAEHVVCAQQKLLLNDPLMDTGNIRVIFGKCACS